MYKQHIFKTLLAGAFSAFLFSCDSAEEIKPQGTYSNGVFVLNEGGFMKGNSSVTFYNPDSKTAIQDIFNTENKRMLGDVAQSMLIHNGKAYIVVNNSSRLEVVDSESFKSVASVETGLDLPRYMAVVNNQKAYITNWGKDQVAVLDLQTNAVGKSIPTGRDPEAILLVGNEAWVANSGNAYGSAYDKTLTIINTQTDQSIKTLDVKDVPVDLKLDANGKVWVLCAGVPEWTQKGTPAHLLRIDPVTKTIDRTIAFAADFKPGKLEISGDKKTLFLSNGKKIFKMSVNDFAVSGQPLVTRNHYGFNVNPANDDLYTTDAVDYRQNGFIIRHKVSGEKLDSVRVGLIPNGVFFR